jgi:hypothetical protein
MLMAAILVMGAIPKIFQTGEQVNQTQSTLNQTQLFLQEQKARDNQTRHEDEARDAQRNQIIKDTNKSLLELEQRLVKFMNESQTRSEKGQQERQKIIDNIINIQQQHNSVSKDHDILQMKVENTTKQTYDLLKTADERNFEATTNNKNLLDNLTQTMQEIKQMHTDIMKALKSVTK